MGETERDRFEEWYRQKFPTTAEMLLERAQDDSYKLAAVARDWNTWQTAVKWTRP